MKQFYYRFIILFFGFFSFAQLSAQKLLVSDVQKKVLDDLAQSLTTQNKVAYQKALQLADQKGWIVYAQSSTGTVTALQGVDGSGFPLFLKTFNNIIAAATTRTNTVQPGGTLGLNLSGSSLFLANKLAIWDGGDIYAGHQEFAGKTITIGDRPVAIDPHSTHVAGTMFAKGVYPAVKGMSFGLNTLLSYDFNNDAAEMAAASSNLLVSNHSYGYTAGWSQNNNGTWTWLGLPGDTVDYKFGFYSPETQAYDKIAYSAQQYLIVQAAGNSRGETGPPVGTNYYGFLSRTDGSIVSKGPRSANISSNAGYDNISLTANAKNILTVGAVFPIPNGPTGSNDVGIAPFSSWGPTDDGRIKPDICGDGVNVTSVGSTGPTAYLTYSGTSMATPNVSGSLFLLQEYYAQLNSGAFMRSATLKGLVCHTALDAGRPGPDYIYGWGLLDVGKAAQALTNNGSKSVVSEKNLAQGQSQATSVAADGSTPLLATISWTDPAADPTTDGTINDRTPKLVNDLDVRISDGLKTYRPWMLDPNNPENNATTGDNIRDNIEQVYIASPVANRRYTVTVSHKGTLNGGSQNYSLIVTGIVPGAGIPADGGQPLSVYPVPASSQLNVAFNAITDSPLTIELFNPAGDYVFTNSQQVKAGVFNTSINTAGIPSGIYYLKVRIGDKTYSKTVSVIK